MKDERYARDRNVIFGLLLVSLTLLWDILIFTTLYEDKSPSIRHALVVISGLLFALGACLAFSAAYDHHKWTDPKRVAAERARLAMKIHLAAKKASFDALPTQQKNND